MAESSRREEGLVGLGFASLAFLVAPAVAMAQTSDEVLLAFDEPGGWRHVELPSVARPSDWSTIHSGVELVLRARADGGASCQVRPVDLDGPARLRWRWRVDQAPRRGDGAARETDDFAARVAIGFEGDWSDAGWLLRREAEALRERLGQWPPRRWIHYVWAGGQRRRGEVFDEPYRPADVKCVALRVGSDPGRSWFDEEVEPCADHVRLFGRPATRIVAVMLMTDADDTGDAADARYARVRIVPGRAK